MRLMRKHEVDALPFKQQIDHRINRRSEWEDDDAEEAEEMERLRRRLLETRPLYVPIDEDEFMRTLPRRRYTRR